MHKIGVSFLLFTFFSIPLIGQSKVRAYSIPSEYVGFIVVSDVNSPLHITDPLYVKYDDGSSRKIYTILNRSEKDVQRFQVKELSWFGNSEYTKDSTVSNFVHPQEAITTISDQEKVAIVQSDDNMMAKLGFDKRPKEIWIIMVTRVEFADGTLFDVTPMYKDIEQIVASLCITSNMSKIELQNAEHRLRRLISDAIKKQSVLLGSHGKCVGQLGNRLFALAACG